MSELNDIVFIKPGLGVGGASYADIDLASHLQEEGARVSFFSGNVDRRIQEHFDDSGIDYDINPALDREHAPSNSEIAGVVGSIGCASTVIISQAFCGREINFAPTALAIANHFPTFVRLYDPVHPEQKENFKQLHAPTKVLALTGLMAAHTEAINPKLENMVLPPLFDIDRYDASLLHKETISSHVRAKLGIGEHDIMLFQPTRASLRKGINYSAMLAARLAEVQDRKVHLVIAGSDSSVKTMDRLTEEAVGRDELPFENVTFLSSVFEGGHRRLPDYIVASDLVVCPSTIEEFGYSTAEAALCKKPAVAREYVGSNGEAVFEEVYGNFDVIKDPLHAKEPTPEVLAEVIDYLERPEAWKMRLHRNHRLAKLYTQQHFTEEPQKLASLLG